MAWARYDDELPMNHKIGSLLAQGVTGAAAIGVHLLANTWSRHNGTAGMVPAAQPGLLVGDQKLGLKLAHMLEHAGMFDVTDGGWMIHDFHEFSDPNDDGRSAAERKAEISAKRAESGRAGGLAKAGKPPSKTGSKPVAPLEQTSGKSLAPNPNPYPSVQVRENPTPENTPAGGGDNSRRSQTIRAYADLAVQLAKQQGKIRSSEEGYRKSALKTGDQHPDLNRWLTEFPEAAPSALAAWMHGDKHSMSYSSLPKSHPNFEATELANWGRVYPIREDIA